MVRIGEDAADDWYWTRLESLGKEELEKWKFENANLASDKASALEHSEQRERFPIEEKIKEDEAPDSEE